MLKRSTILVIAALVFTTTPAFADASGVHNRYDLRIKVLEAPHIDLRLAPELWFSTSTDGLRFSELRAGPSWRAAKWFTFGLNGFAGRTFNGKEDARAEMQPDFTVRPGSFVFNDRNRIGYRFVDAAAGDRWRYANEVKASYDDPECPWVPFLSDEIQIGSKAGLSENRASAGVGYKWSEGVRTDAGYMLRHVHGTGWDREHVTILGVSISR
jgi:opacity protein-like surface antigen